MATQESGVARISSFEDEDECLGGPLGAITRTRTQDEIDRDEGTMTQPKQDLAGELTRLAQAKELARIEELWLERLDELPTQSAFYKSWIKEMRHAGATERTEELIGLLVDHLLSSDRARPALRILLATIPFYPHSETLRPHLLRAMRGYYREIDNLETLLQLARLDGPDAKEKSLVEGFKAFREWERLTPGQVWQHYDWGEGVVQELDLDARKVRFAFRHDANKEMTVEGARRYLRYLEPTHFLARRAKEPETLARLAETDPVGLIKAVLASQEGSQIKQGELKTLLTHGVMPAEEWNNWWSKAREALKLDPYIDFDAGAGARAVIQLRERPRSFAEEVREQFFAADAGTVVKAELIRQMARKPKETELPDKLLEKMAERLEEEWRLAGDEHPARRLEIAYMLEDLAALRPGGASPRHDAGPLLDQIGEDYTALVELDHVDYGIRALEALMHRDGEAGCRRAAELLPHAEVKLAQAIWKALDEEQHAELAVAALQQMLDDPLENPDTYAWAVRAILDGSWGHLEDYFPASAIVQEVLDHMETWHRLAGAEGADRERAEGARKLLGKMRTLLAAGKYEAISKAVDQAHRDLAARLRAKIADHPALSATFKQQADRVIRVTRPELEGTGTAAMGAGPSIVQKSDELLCTEWAYQKKAAELREITAVKIPRNSKVIEEARMEGDLRENAGYQYAKEEQKMLVQTQASLTDMLSRAVIRHARDVDATRVGFGTRIVVQNLDEDVEENYTILGRWEADPEKHVLSMQAPLAMQFSGRREGEELTVERPGGGTTRYRILRIENALATGEWDRPAAPEAEPVKAGEGG